MKGTCSGGGVFSKRGQEAVEALAGGGDLGLGSSTEVGAEVKLVQRAKHLCSSKKLRREVVE